MKLSQKQNFCSRFAFGSDVLHAFCRLRRHNYGVFQPQLRRSGKNNSGNGFGRQTHSALKSAETATTLKDGTLKRNVQRL